MFNTKTKPENPDCTNIFSSSDFNLSQVCAKLWLTGLGYIPSDKEKNRSFNDKWHKKENSIKVSIRHTPFSLSASSASLCCRIYWKIKAFFYGWQKFQKKRRKHLQSAHFERGIIPCKFHTSSNTFKYNLATDYFNDSAFVQSSYFYLIVYKSNLEILVSLGKD